MSKAAPAGVGRKDVRRTHVLPAARAATATLGEGGHVAQAEVQPLPGEGVEPVRGVADEGKARR